MSDAQRPLVAVVPGLAVQEYLAPALTALEGSGVDVQLVRPPGTGGFPSLTEFGTAVGKDSLDRPVDLLVGFSAGVFVAAAAAGASSTTSAIALVGPVHTDSWIDLGRRWVRAGVREPRALVLQQAREWLTTPPPRLLRALRSTRHTDLDALVDAVDCPVHVVRGEHDAMTSDALARRLVRRGGRLHVVPGASHSWPFQDPEGFVRVVKDVLTEG